jgi:hypothetical protein
MASLRAHIHHNPPTAVKSASARANTMARLKRDGPTKGADAIAGAWLTVVTCLPIGLLKILLHRTKSGTLARPSCSWPSSALTSLVALAVVATAGPRTRL